MTGCGPCFAVRLPICVRICALPPFDEKLINNGSAARMGVIFTQTFSVWSMTFYVRTLTFL